MAGGNQHSFNGSTDSKSFDLARGTRGKPAEIGGRHGSDQSEDRFTAQPARRTTRALGNEPRASKKSVDCKAASRFGVSGTCAQGSPSATYRQGSSRSGKTRTNRSHQVRAVRRTE